MYAITNAEGQRVWGNKIVSRAHAEEIAPRIRLTGETLQVRRDGVVVTLVNDQGIQQLTD